LYGGGTGFGGIGNVYDTASFTVTGCGVSPAGFVTPEGGDAPSGGGGTGSVGSDVSSDVSSASPAGCAGTCGTPNGDPTIEMTLTWTDSDTTKSWLGCTWTNGECKTVYADTYEFAYGRQVWDKDTDGFGMRRAKALSTSVSINLRGNTDKVLSSYVFKNDLGILGVGDVPTISDYILLDKQKNNTFTDANGITYTWVEGTGW
jgi:hypothetical protein